MYVYVCVCMCACVHVCVHVRVRVCVWLCLFALWGHPVQNASVRGSCLLFPRFRGQTRFKGRACPLAMSPWRLEDWEGPRGWGAGQPLGFQEEAGGPGRGGGSRWEETG